MKYFIQVLWLLSWPALIYVSYVLVKWALALYEKKYPPAGE